MIEDNSLKGAPDSGDGIKIENVWQQDSETKKEVIDFWLREKVVPAVDNVLERADQVVMVARDPEGNIAGVCTAYIKYLPSLLNNFYYYRSYVSHSYRHQGLASDLIRQSRKFFNKLFQEGQETKAIGIYLEIENDYLKQIKKTIWWRGIENFVFIGIDKRGSHHRISYFDNAVISE
jgi:hypothetical protein